MVMEMARRNEQREREISWYERKIVANTETTKKKEEGRKNTRWMVMKYETYMVWRMK